ncbi:hypothetical protein F5J12DRAFT_786861 [Pisolithus orientalis]|uniref:uncharacterized protein n=1 Tax=Pisolithus orientalis TaxID=936130 RepID=UPI0022241ED4|nr:uncharacterized protein F5J12DRAFT_786861 [Pisolithus orientalis]KAI5988465.1 hypothetical protein F5J12DRAFT_786861 [Pisolithus orientalis]
MPSLSVIWCSLISLTLQQSCTTWNTRWSPWISMRKQMSVIIHAPDGRIILYCKGADTIIYKQLLPDVNPVLKEKTTKDGDMFANGGLRTMQKTVLGRSEGLLYLSLQL